MAASKSPKHESKGPRIRFVGLAKDESPPEVVVAAIGKGGKVLQSSRVADDGRFDLSKDALSKAHRVLIGPADEEPSVGNAAFSRYRPQEFAAALDVGLNVARAQWKRWLLFTDCVTGSVWKCQRSPWWYDDLVTLSNPRVARLADAGRLARIPAARSLPELLRWPARCHTICNGVVEVWRRVCCCEPWVIDDPRLDDLLEQLEEVGPFPPFPEDPRVIPRPDPDPDPGPRPDPIPGPGPGPAPFLMPAALPFLREGTLDEMALFAQRDLATLRSLPRTAIPDYINARPYLRCRFYSCGQAVKVAEGPINPDGRFNICWRQLPQSLRAGCHVEYAYKVRQQFGPFSITVYNGVAANRWFGAGADARLESYSALAFSCRGPGEPGTGAFVYLDEIGDTSSHELETPNAQAWDRVFTPGATSGTLFPNAAAVYNRHRNLGGVLKLNYMFSEDLKLVGAKYYRIGIVEADSLGDPIPSTHHYYDQGLSWRKAVPVGGGVDIVPVSLGPNPAPIGGQSYLYEIPYDTDADWEAGQYHAHLDTTDARWSDPLARHLVTIEIFDAAGKRLRPNGTPATGQPGAEGTAAFTYRRKTAATGPTANVPFGALTHLLWWDNRDVQGDILQLRRNGVPSSAECQFLVGSASTQFSIDYEAWHPQALFHRFHRLWWQRGLGGGSGYLDTLNTTNVVPPGATSPSASFATMLDLAGDPTRTRCAFTVFLGVYGKRTNGDDLGYPYLQRSAAFALEVVP